MGPFPHPMAGSAPRAKRGGPVFPRPLSGPRATPVPEAQHDWEGYFAAVASTGVRPFLNPAFVRQLLWFLHEVGFNGAPRYLGVDSHGNERVSYAVGWTPDGLNWGRWTDEQLQSAFGLLRQFHDATA